MEQEIGDYAGEHREPYTAIEQQENFAGHEILEEIAQGGMGIIYRAQKHSSGKIVALKVLKEAYRSSPEAKKRFAREAGTLKRLQHPNIVAIYEVGIEKRRPTLPWN